MCGRFYVDEGTAKEIERVIRGVDLRIQKMCTGDIYPSQSAGILTCHSQQKNSLSADSAAENSPALELTEMHWGFPQYQKKGLLINARAETALENWRTGFMMINLRNMRFIKLRQSFGGNRNMSSSPKGFYRKKLAGNKAGILEIFVFGGES